MTKEDLITQYNIDKPTYQKWGKYVKEQIVNQILEEDFELNEILKMPVKPRVKEMDSLIAKAFYRGKKYKDPYGDITDKVGIRFVVLTLDQVSLIKEIVESRDPWTYTHDVDFKKNMEEKPELFTYQSVHYVVRCKSDFFVEGIKIPRGMPCEIQIRTLLQHAYAELSHDTIYKKDEEISPKVKRIMARSMALIETTDNLFKEVGDLLSQEDKLYTDYEECVQKYIPFNHMTKNLNKFVYLSYKDFVRDKGISLSDIKAFIDSKPHLLERISTKQDLEILYRQPIIFLLYYLIENFNNQMVDRWPLEEELLKPLFSDLGISMMD